MPLQTSPSLPKKRDVYRQFVAGERDEHEAREIIGDDWNTVVTGVMMKDDLETMDWEDRYSDEDLF